MRRKKSKNKERRSTIERESVWMFSTIRTIHHIHSEAEFPQLERTDWNFIILPKMMHVLYHFFFNHASPKRIARYAQLLFSKGLAILILEEINQKFWGNLYEISLKGNWIKIELKSPFKEEFEKLNPKARK